MKKFWIMFAACLSFRDLSAQTFSEWFSQKKTQLKYLQQQISALEAFGGDLKEGYGIIQKGTGLISEIGQEDLDLHSGYFASLQAVNPAVSGDIRITEIRVLQGAISQNDQVCKDVLQGAPGSPYTGLFTTVLSQLTASVTMQMGLLQGLLTAGNMQMTDAERTDRIETVYLSMEKLYRFSVYVRNNVMLTEQATK